MKVGSRREDLGIVAFCLIACVVVAILQHLAGCAGPAGPRKAILAASKATEIAVQETRAHCRKLATSGCKTNPCPWLIACHEAEGFVGDGAALLQRGLQKVNEVVPDGND